MGNELEVGGGEEEEEAVLRWEIDAEGKLEPNYHRDGS